MSSQRKSFEGGEVLDRVPARPVALMPGDDGDIPVLYRLLTVGEMIEKPLPRWIVKGLLPEVGVGIFYGETGSLKSYLALDLAYAVADGDENGWFGFKVMKAPVVYCCLEGNAGFGTRVRAIQATRGGEHPNLRFMDGGAFALDDDENVMRLAQSIKAAHCAPGTLIIIDTLACASGNADENSTRDSRMLIHAAKRLAWAVGGFVLLVHHTGKDVSNGPRGGSNFRADTDCVIRVVKASEESNGVGYWTSAKVKDGKDGGRYGFEVEWAEIGRDDDGEPVYSGVVRPLDEPVIVNAEPPNKGGRPAGRGKNQDAVFNAIVAALRERGTRQIHRTAAESVAIDALHEAGIERAKERARAILKSLCETGRLECIEDYFHVPSGQDE